jgi:single-strand DNA-binding protein
MASLNRCCFIGNLGQDPEMKYMPSGDAVANVSIACNETWKDRDSGEKQERVEWVRLVFFKKLAEIVGEYLAKGSQIYAEGRMQTRKWTDKQGVDRYSTEIVCDKMVMLGSKDGSQGQQREQRPAAAEHGSTRQPAKKGGGASFDDMSDDIPFAVLDIHHSTGACSRHEKKSLLCMRSPETTYVVSKTTPKF